MENLKNINIKDENIVSFKKINLEIPLQSPFSKKIKTNLIIHDAKIELNDKILKKDKGLASTKSPFEIKRINIINGQLSYKGEKIFAELLNFNLKSFRESNVTLYELNSPHLKIIFPISGGKVKLEGNMESKFRSQQTSWKVRHFSWKTEDLDINLNGRIFKNGSIALSARFKGSPEQILISILKNLTPVGKMEGAARIRRKKREKLIIEGEFEYDKFSIDKENFDNLRGTAKWDDRNKQIRVDTYFNDNFLRTHLKISSKSKVTRIHGENVSAEKIAKIIKIHQVVPFGGIIQGADFKVEKRIISGTVKLGTESLKGDEAPQKVPENFNINGEANFSFNSRIKSVEFYAKNLITEFGSLTSLEGVTDPTKETNLKLKAEAKINEMSNLHKYMNHYINLDLSSWKLKKGSGVIALNLKKIGNKFFVESDININNFISRNQSINSLTGHISTRNSLTSGNFIVEDKDLKGKARLFLGKDYFTIDFKDIEGESQKALKILEIDISLTGQMQGNFFLTKKANEFFPLVQGNFKAKRINFYDFYFDNIRGELEYYDHISLKNLACLYNDGKGTADIFIDYNKEIYSLEGEIKGIDIKRIHPEFIGRGDIYFKGDGIFNNDPIKFNYSSGELYFYKDRNFFLKGKGKIFTDFSNFRIETNGNVLNETSYSPFTFKLNQKNNNYTGSFELNLTDINLLIPWGNNRGTMELEGQIFSDADGSLSAEGHALFRGGVFSFPNFPHALENFQGDIIFKGLNFKLWSLQGTIGGGKVESSGYLNIKNNQLEDLDINFVGKKMNLYPMDRTNFTMNADLNLKYVDKKLLLSGHFNALSGIWKREIDEGVSFYTDPSLSSSGSRLLDMLEFDLKLIGNENIIIENSFIKATGKFDLKLTGNRDFPILLGYVDCREGEINFSDKKFDLIKAKLVFNNKFMIDPQMNIESESFIKNYRIRFDVKGTSSRPKPELQSTPPLSTMDILSLIRLGELFKRPDSTELSSRIGTFTTGYIFSKLITDPIRKGTKKIFGNYMLKIDPNISNIAGVSVEESSRLIVGKEISKDFLIIMTYPISTQRQPVVLYLQYHLSPSISLIGMRNEEARYSIDIRFRKRH